MESAAIRMGQPIHQFVIYSERPGVEEFLIRNYSGSQVKTKIYVLAAFFTRESTLVRYPRC